MHYKTHCKMLFFCSKYGYRSPGTGFYRQYIIYTLVGIFWLAFPACHLLVIALVPDMQLSSYL